MFEVLKSIEVIWGLIAGLFFGVFGGVQWAWGRMTAHVKSQVEPIAEAGVDTVNRQSQITRDVTDLTYRLSILEERFSNLPTKEDTTQILVAMARMEGEAKANREMLDTLYQTVKERGVVK